jgi:hypothetical protein
MPCKQLTFIFSSDPASNWRYEGAFYICTGIGLMIRLGYDSYSMYAHTYILGGQLDAIWQYVCMYESWNEIWKSTIRRPAT